MLDVNDLCKGSGMRLFVTTVLVLAGCSLGGNEQPQTIDFVSTSEVAMTTKIDVLLPETARHHADKVYETFAHVESTANEWKEEVMRYWDDVSGKELSPAAVRQARAAV